MSIIFKKANKLLIFNQFKNSLTTQTSTTERVKLADLIKVKPYSELAINEKPGSIYFPKYLDQVDKFPSYNLLNINLYSYNYVPLNSYFKYVTRLCKRLDIDLVESYPMPARTYSIKAYKQHTMGIDYEFKLSKYHRCVRIKNLKSSLAPILYEVIQMNLPEGVSLEILEPTLVQDNFRYVPDVELNQLKDQLNQIES